MIVTGKSLVKNDTFEDATQFIPHIGPSKDITIEQRINLPFLLLLISILIIGFIFTIFYCYKKRHFKNLKSYGMMTRKFNHKPYNDDWDTDLIEDEREQQNQMNKSKDHISSGFLHFNQ